ncbi:hypothetical protein FACHB389_09150 [Nostoc calcicola FACHB-389]|nr:hypothetical protein [Nostoc calcicola FACHB-3891]OKH38228.1 hypothetical protein FACHB389_09150 [Nostoc calcicola FACHB-389]
MTQTRVRLWNVDEYHRMVETGIIAADERVELIEGQVIPMSAKNPPDARKYIDRHPAPNEIFLRGVMRKAPVLQPGDISEQDKFIYP